MKIEDEVVNLLITSKKVCKSDWELKQLEKKGAPKGLKTLTQADVNILLPTSFLRQLTWELVEEFAFDMRGLDEILSKTTYVSISMAQEGERMLVSFHLQEKDVQDVVTALEAKDLVSKQEGEFILFESDNFTLKIPTKGGIGLIFSNVRDEDMKDVDPSAISTVRAFHGRFHRRCFSFQGCVFCDSESKGLERPVERMAFRAPLQFHAKTERIQNT